MNRRFNWIGMSADGTTVTLKKQAGLPTVPSYATEDWIRENSGSLRNVVAVDVETTGLDPLKDQIIEIAIRGFQFSVSTGEIVSFGEAYASLQDPGVPLVERICSITGLSDDQLRGTSIDWGTVKSHLCKADIVVAHNARFDRPFLEKYCAALANNIWACSLKQIDWDEKGYPVHRLDVLSIYHGFFSDAHRAQNDVDALINLISQKDPRTGAPYLLELYSNTQRPVVLLAAKDAPYETRSQLRERGYRWHREDRCWKLEIYKELLDKEIRWLEENIYYGRFPGEATEISMYDVFRR